MKLFAAITKVDAAQRMVFGYASTEALDSQGEVVKIDAIEAALPDYMKFANIREMHQPSAVGIAKEASVDDKGLYLAVKVVDDAAWEKVTEGVYKGFSIGGRATKRDTLDKSVITGLKLTEISLVDRPANPEATFDVFKADGDNTSDDIQDEVLDADTGAPVDDNVSAKADAPDDISKADDENTEQLNAVDTLAEMLTKGDIAPDRIVELATHDIEIKKGMYHVGQLAYMLKELGWLVTDQAYEALREGDGSEVPAQLKAWLTQGVTILNAMVDEETGELIATTGVDYDGTNMLPDVEIYEASDKATDVEKAGKRNSKADQEKIQTMHDHCCALGAECTNDASGNSKKAEAQAATDALNKVYRDTPEVAAMLTKMGFAENAGFVDIVNKMTSRITELESQPTIGKALLRAVSKSADVIVVDDQVKKESEPVFKSGEEKAKYLLTKMYQQGRSA